MHANNRVDEALGPLWLSDIPVHTSDDNRSMGSKVGNNSGGPAGVLSISRWRYNSLCLQELPPHNESPPDRDCFSLSLAGSWQA
jgi:hypothetical protein